MLLVTAHPHIRRGGDRDRRATAHRRRGPPRLGRPLGARSRRARRRPVGRRLGARRPRRGPAARRGRGRGDDGTAEDFVPHWSVRTRADKFGTPLWRATRTDVLDGEGPVGCGRDAPLATRDALLRRTPPVRRRRGYHARAARATATRDTHGNVAADRGEGPRAAARAGRRSRRASTWSSALLGCCEFGDEAIGITDAVNTSEAA